MGNTISRGRSQGETPLKKAEKEVLLQFLIRHSGNASEVSRRLFINRNTVQRLIEIHNIPIEAIRTGAYRGEK